LIPPHHWIHISLLFLSIWCMCLPDLQWVATSFSFSFFSFKVMFGPQHPILSLQASFLLICPWFFYNYLFCFNLFLKFSMFFSFQIPHQRFKFSDQPLQFHFPSHLVLYLLITFFFFNNLSNYKYLSISPVLFFNLSNLIFILLIVICFNWCHF
jgi:hypothetical protein